MSQTKDALTTTELFAAAHEALCTGKWSLARCALDLLGQRDDNRDQLAPAASYRVPAHLAQLIQDRIDLVNAKAS